LKNKKNILIKICFIVVTIMIGIFFLMKENEISSGIYQFNNNFAFKNALNKIENASAHRMCDSEYMHSYSSGQHSKMQDGDKSLFIGNNIFVQKDNKVLIYTLNEDGKPVKKSEILVGKVSIYELFYYENKLIIASNDIASDENDTTFTTYNILETTNPIKLGSVIVSGYIRDIALNENKLYFRTRAGNEVTPEINNKEIEVSNKFIDNNSSDTFGNIVGVIDINQPDKTIVALVIYTYCGYSCFNEGEIALISEDTKFHAIRIRLDDDLFTDTDIKVFCANESLIIDNSEKSDFSIADFNDDKLRILAKDVYKGYYHLYILDKNMNIIVDQKLVYEGGAVDAMSFKSDSLYFRTFIYGDNKYDKNYNIDFSDLNNIKIDIKNIESTDEIYTIKDPRSIFTNSEHTIVGLFKKADLNIQYKMYQINNDNFEFIMEKEIITDDELKELYKFYLSKDNSLSITYRIVKSDTNSDEMIVKEEYYPKLDFNEYKEAFIESTIFARSYISNDKLYIVIPDAKIIVIDLKNKEIIDRVNL